MSDKDLPSHQIMQRRIEREDVDYELKNYEMPVNQQAGVRSEQRAALRSRLQMATHPARRPAARRAFGFRAALPGLHLARLHQIPRVLEQTTEVMRQGMKDGLMPPKIVVEKLPGECDGIIVANPFLLPTKKFPLPARYRVAFGGSSRTNDHETSAVWPLP